MYEWKVSGEKMKEPVIIKTEGETTLQAIFQAREEAEKMNLEWDEIEYVI